MAADGYKVMAHQGDKENQTLGMGMTLALIKNLNSKNYFTGLNNLLDAISASGSEDDRTTRLEKFTQAYLSGFVPGIVNNMNYDPYMREARGVLDAVLKRIPGYSEGVDPVRNTLGERVAVPDTLGPRFMSPFAVSHEKDDPVQAELARQAELSKGGYSTPAAHVKLPHAPAGANVDLRDFDGGNGYSAYDRYQELVGSTKIGGKTLRDSLGELIQSGNYQNRLTDSSEAFEGSRKQAINAVIGKYREAARGLLFQENGDVREAATKAARGAAITKIVGPQAVGQQ